ncbi:hypothetical protein SMICM304S_05632 [Streptomyces microflavus]
MAAGVRDHRVARPAAALPARRADRGGGHGGRWHGGGLPGAGQACTDPEASLPPSSADGPGIAKIKARGKLVAGVDQNSFRWGYRNPYSGELEGFDIDLAASARTSSATRTR